MLLKELTLCLVSEIRQNKKKGNICKKKSETLHLSWFDVGLVLLNVLLFSALLLYSKNPTAQKYSTFFISRDTYVRLNRYSLCISSDEPAEDIKKSYAEV